MLSVKTIVRVVVPMCIAVSWTAAAADDSEVGCKILLCLSDPRGSTTEAECHPPIAHLQDRLKRGKPFPKCSMAGNSDTGQGSFARLVYDPFDPCPDGLTDVPDGTVLAPGRLVGRQLQATGPVAVSNQKSDVWMGATKACVGKFLGSGTAGDADSPYTVNVYDRVVWMKWQAPRAVDVYVDGKLFKRTRF